MSGNTIALPEEGDEGNSKPPVKQRKDDNGGGPSIKRSSPSLSAGKRNKCARKKSINVLQERLLGQH